jgi:arylsulfatase A-like enzyme
VLDDVGYGHVGSYGGPIDTPNLEKLAAGGLRDNNFHTTALCSPSRGALLTGRNHHAIGLAAITEAATGYPGSYGSIPKSAATVVESLKQNGYNTMALGKWHLTPYTAYTSAGPFDRWPLGMGFEKFYGFLGGETDQWAPLLAQDNHFIDTPTRPGYHLTEDLVDQTIASIRDITRLFGAQFAEAIVALPPGTWQGPIPSGYGVPLVIVDERHDGRLPHLDAVRREWENARRQERTEQFYRHLIEKYTIIVERPKGSVKDDAP